MTRVRVRKPIDLTTGPANLDRVGLVVVRQAKRQNEFARREVTGAATQHLRLRFAACAQSYGSTDTVAVGFCTGQFDAQTVVQGCGALRFIPKQIHRAAVGGKQ